MRLALKAYQKETIARLGDYCDSVRAQTVRGSPRPERDAFDVVAGRDYFSPPGFDGGPLCCLRLPKRHAGIFAPSAGPSGPPYRYRADCDGDADVDMLDFAQFQLAFAG